AVRDVEQVVDHILAIRIELPGRCYSVALLAARQDDAEPLRVELIRRLEPQTAVRARDQGDGAIRCGAAHGFQTMAVAFVVLRRSAGGGAGPTPSVGLSRDNGLKVLKRKRFEIGIPRSFVTPAF